MTAGFPNWTQHPWEEKPEVIFQGWASNCEVGGCDRYGMGMLAGSRRVAVVIEDDADIRNLLEAILAQAGFTCYTTGAGLEGIAAIRQYDPILTTLDISLPGIDGFEVTRQIRSFSNTYIIVLSARNEEIDTLMGLDAGADDYLTKPFRPRSSAHESKPCRRQPRWSFSRPSAHRDAGRRAGARPRTPPIVADISDDNEDMATTSQAGFRTTGCGSMPTCGSVISTVHQ
jgi:CheY-like chemotaxis protein